MRKSSCVKSACGQTECIVMLLCCWLCVAVGFRGCVFNETFPVRYKLDVQTSNMNDRVYLAGTQVSFDQFSILTGNHRQAMWCCICTAPPPTGNLTEQQEPLELCLDCPPRRMTWGHANCWQGPRCPQCISKIGPWLPFPANLLSVSYV